MKNNVIDISQRRKTPKKPVSPISKAPHTTAPVVDMTERRQEIILEERRLNKRTVLNEFVGAFVVIPEQGLRKVAISDISENGMAFDFTSESGHFHINEEVAMRVYLSQTTYFPFYVRITNLRVMEEDGMLRHGGIFVKGSIHDDALRHFIKFIETVSEHLATDRGDLVLTSTKS